MPRLRNYSSENVRKIMKLGNVVEVTGLSRSSIYRRIDDNSFPRPISLGGKAVGWVEAEVQQWIQYRIIERDERK